MFFFAEVARDLAGGRPGKMAVYEPGQDTVGTCIYTYVCILRYDNMSI